MYGFAGAFAVRRAEWVDPRARAHRRAALLAPGVAAGSAARKGKLVYFLWELEAVKSARG